jgi:hypothetical protein
MWTAWVAVAAAQEAPPPEEAKEEPGVGGPGIGIGTGLGSFTRSSYSLGAANGDDAGPGIAAGYGSGAFSMSLRFRTGPGFTFAPIVLGAYEGSSDQNTLDSEVDRDARPEERRLLRLDTGAVLYFGVGERERTEADVLLHVLYSGYRIQTLTDNPDDTDGPDAVGSVLRLREGFVGTGFAIEHWLGPSLSLTASASSHVLHGWTRQYDTPRAGEPTVAGERDQGFEIIVAPSTRLELAIYW